MKILYVTNSAAGEATGKLAWTPRLAARGARAVFALPEGERDWFDEYKRRGAGVVAWPLERRTHGPRKTLAAALGLRAAIRREQPDLIHACGHEANFYASLACALSGRPPFVLHVTGLGSAFLPRPGVAARALRLFYRLNPGGARLALFENADDREELGLVRTGGGLKAAVVEGAGVDLAHFDPAAVAPATRVRLRAEWGAGERAVVVVSIGRLIRDKGVEELLEAWRRVHDRPGALDARLVLVGDAEPGDGRAVSDLAARAGRSARTIRLLGRRRDVREILASADLFLNASHREGLPRTNLEALAMGVPVLTTTAIGCRNTVEHGASGWAVPPRDGEKLAGALEMLIRDAGLRERLGAAGRRRATEMYSVETIVDQIWERYERAFGGEAIVGSAREATP